MASRWAAIPWPEFKRMDGREQSLIVAAYRTENRIEALLAHQANKKAEGAARQGYHSGGLGSKR